MAFFIPSILVQGIYTGIIGTISSVTMSTCALVKTVYTHENPNIKKIIKAIDIERKLRLVTAVIGSIDTGTQRNITDLEKTQISDLIMTVTGTREDPIEICLIYLHKTIRDIRADLLAIDRKAKYHRTLWLSSWRSLDVSSELASL